LNALERRTGVHSAPPDRFQITSLDVIVHEHQKLGTGGFGQVYVGDWHGAAVAIKVFERGVPQSVSLGSEHDRLSFHFDTLFRLWIERSVCGNSSVTPTFFNSMVHAPSPT
jgi:hypothetical protein